MTMPMSESVRRRRRVQLLLVFAVFAAPVALALWLGAIGWRPGTDGYGQPVMPQRNLKDVAVAMADGGTWAWRTADKPRMTLVALPGPSCAEQCLATLALVRNARITLNKNMDRLRLLYLGTPPRGGAGAPVMRSWPVGRDVAQALQDFRAQRPDTVAVLLVESNGTALSWYPAPLDPQGLKDDLHKVFH